MKQKYFLYLLCYKETSFYFDFHILIAARASEHEIMSLVCLWSKKDLGNKQRYH